MANRKPFAERVLDTIIALHNQESGYEDEGEGKTAYKYEEPILTYMYEKNLVSLNGPNQDIPHLTQTGRQFYVNLLAMVQSQVVR